MARTGTDENKQANTQASAWQQDAVNRTNKQTDLYNTERTSLKAGNNIGANPWANPDYLRNANIKTDAALSSASDAAADQVNHEALRTGENTEARKATVADLARSKMRLNNELTAGRYQDDYNNNVDYQKFLLGSTLAPTGADTSLFSTATGQRSNALGNLTSIGNASYGMWNSILGGVGPTLSGIGAIKNGPSPT